MRWWPVWVLLVAALTAACSGGSDGEREATPTAEPPLQSAGEGADGALRYVALGDSIATGFLAAQGYVERYADYLEAETGEDVRLTNLARNGWTSADLLAALQGDPAFQDAVRRADVITWDIGGNDALAARRAYKNGTCGGQDNQRCLRVSVERFQEHWDAIVAELLRLRQDDGTVLLTMDVYNPFAARDAAEDSWEGDGGRSDLEVLGGFLDEVNRYIAASAAEHGIPYASVSAAFNGTSGGGAPGAAGYLAPDGVHPSDAGHRVIAGLLRELASVPGT